MGVSSGPGVFLLFPDKPEEKPKPPMGTNPMQGDETNPMESPAMLSTEEIAERARKVEDARPEPGQFGKSSAFDAAWVLLKERIGSRRNRRYRNEKMFGVPENQKDRKPQRASGQSKRFPSSFDAPPETGKKQHPSTSYGQRNPAMTSQPGASLRTGPVAAQASQQDMDEFMRINSAQEHQDMLQAESVTDEKRSPTDEMRLRGLNSVFARPDKAADRLAHADAMHGEDIQSIFEEQGIPVTSKVGEDIERNIDKPRPELEDDDLWHTAVSNMTGEVPRHLRNVDFDKELAIGLKELAEFNRLHGVESDNSHWF